MAAISSSKDPNSSNQVLPVSMWPTTAGASEASAKELEDSKSWHESRARQEGNAADQLSQLTEGAFSEEAVNALQRLGVDHQNLAIVCDAFARAERQSVRFARRLADELDDIESRAQQLLSSTPPVGRPTIIAAANAEAIGALTAHTVNVERAHAKAEAEAAPHVAAMQRQTQSPNATERTTQALDNGLEERSELGRDVNQPGEGLEERGGKRAGQSSGNARNTSSPNGLDQRASGQAGGAPRNDGSTQVDHAGSNGLEQRADYTESAPVGSGRLGLTPRRSAVQPSPSSTGGVGGGDFSPSGGLGSGGLGSVPLSPLTSGGNGLPGSASSGPGVAPGRGSGPSSLSSPTGAAVEAGAMSRAATTGNAAAGIASSMSPPMMGPATPAANSGAPTGGPLAGVSNGLSAVPAGLAGSGAHASTAPVAAGGVGGAVPPAGSGMMMPAPGMGAPSAPGGVVTPGSSTSASIPVSSAGPAGSGSSAGIGAGAAGGPTVLPAGVATPVAAATRQPDRRLSPDALEAAAVAWALTKACEAPHPMAWAAGVFRSPIGSETVVVGSEGFGYVPESVFLPRSVRVLAADPLVDNDFRLQWFGWADPAEVLLEYARLRRAEGWSLVAAATTARVDALRLAGIEYVEANPYKGYCPPGVAEDWKPPSLDHEHVHRLASVHPDLYERLERVARADSARMNDRVMFPLAQRLMPAALTVECEDVPSVLRASLQAVEANTEKDWPHWGRMQSDYRNFAMRVGSNSPGGVDADLRPEDVPVGLHEHYRGLWKVARAMEFMLGWSQSPLPLADMAYAAAVSGLIDIHEVLDQPLEAVEGDLE